MASRAVLQANLVFLQAGCSKAGFFARITFRPNASARGKVQASAFAHPWIPYVCHQLAMSRCHERVSR
jgi:hypothetical protein